MARHRSPRGRRAHRIQLGEHPAGPEARRSTTPLQRGAAAVVVSGGALSLVAAGAPAAAGIAPVVPAAATTANLQITTVATVEPVAPEPEVADAQMLLKAVQLVEQQVETQRVAAEAAAKAAADQAAAAEKAADKTATDRAAAAAAPSASANCGLDTSGIGRVAPNVRSAAEFLGCRFGEPTIYGVAGRANASDHPSGLALDIMVDRATGDALASCARKNRDALGISYVIYRQRIDTGSGWEAMEDRGGTTANHMDHVHISFERGASVGGLSC